MVEVHFKKSSLEKFSCYLRRELRVLRRAGNMIQRTRNNKPERVFGLQVRCRELDIIWEEFFGRNSLGEILCFYIGIDLFVKILVFVKILSQWRKEGKNLDP